MRPYGEIESRSRLRGAANVRIAYAKADMREGKGARRALRIVDGNEVGHITSVTGRARMRRVMPKAARQAAKRELARELNS